MNVKAGSSYAHTFRAIGQSISKLDPLYFDLELVGNDYTVSGVSKTPLNAAEKNTRTENNFSSGFSNLRFTQSEVDVINGTGKQSRADTDVSRVDPHSIPNVLRTIGAYLDARGLSFLRLSLDNGNLTVWHINNMQVETKEIFTPINIYDLWVRYFKKREQRNP
jgi:hypothetical protein